MIKAIFFDMAGVIYEDGLKAGIFRYEQEFDVPHGKLYTILHDHHGWKDFSLGRISENDFLKLCEARSVGCKFDWSKIIDYIVDCSVVHSNVIQLLKELSSKVLIGVISNNPLEWFELFLKKHNIQDLIKVKAVSGYMHVRKPSREIFVTALQMANVFPHEAIYVDDREEMVVEAKALGIHTVIFNGNIEKLKADINFYYN